MHGGAMFQGGAVETTSAGGRAVRELAAEKIDARHELLQNVEPATLDIPTLCPVPTVACPASRHRGRVFPEVLIEVLVFQDAKHERLVFLQHVDQMT